MSLKGRVKIPLDDFDFILNVEGGRLFVPGHPRHVLCPL